MYRQPQPELENAQFEHLLLSCTSSFTADLSRGCSEAMSKLILQSNLVSADTNLLNYPADTNLVSARGWINDQTSHGGILLCHRNACSLWRHQGSMQLPQPLWHLCNALQGWLLQKICGPHHWWRCFHMLLQSSPYSISAAQWNTLFQNASLMLAAPSPVKDKQEESFDAHHAGRCPSMKGCGEHGLRGVTSSSKARHK